MHEMIAERPDWCISRQRFWGVPLIIFYCDACSRAARRISRRCATSCRFSSSEGADAWYTHTAEELLPAGTRCACGATRWRKENDILDVWFDSGSTHLAVLDPPGQPNADLPWPADMYLEGPDQYRGWFHSSLLIGVGARGRAPYRQVLTHGWTLDEQGRPMSKSLGNVVLPTEICEKWGADLLRLWVASQDYTADVRMSTTCMTQLSEAYRKIRNTFRFALGNLADFDPARDAVAEGPLEELDRWMLARTAAWWGNCRGVLRGVRFPPRLSRAARLLRRGPERVLFRRAEGPALHLCAAKSAAALRADRHLSHRQRAGAAAGADPGVHGRGNLEIFAAASGRCRTACTWRCSRSRRMPRVPDEALEARWEHLLEVRAAVLKSLEQARNAKTINSGLEARVELSADGALEPTAAGLRGIGCRRCSSFRRWSSPIGELPAGARSETLPGLGVPCARRRQKVRALLELFDARRRKRRLSHRLRALRRRSAGDRAGASERGAGADGRALLMAARSARWLWLTLAVVAADRATKYAIERFTAEGFSARLCRISPPWCTA